MYMHIYLHMHHSLTNFYPSNVSHIFRLFPCVPCISHFSPISETTPILQYFLKREFLLLNIVQIKLLISHNSYTFPLIPSSSPHITWHKHFLDWYYTSNRVPHQTFRSSTLGLGLYQNIETEYLVLLSSHLNLTLPLRHFSSSPLTSSTSLMPTPHCLLPTQVSLPAGPRAKPVAYPSPSDNPLNRQASMPDSSGKFLKCSKINMHISIILKIINPRQGRHKDLDTKAAVK